MVFTSLSYFWFRCRGGAGWFVRFPSSRGMGFLPSGRGPGKPGSFKTFPVRTGCRGSPAASKPPFSFSEEKENAPFDGVREKGSAAAFRASPGTLAAPFTGVLVWCLPEGPDHSTTYGSYESRGWFRMPRPPLLLPHLGSCGSLAWGALPDALSYSFAAAPWQFGLAWRGGGSGCSGSCGGLAPSYFRLSYVAWDGSCDCRSAARLRKGKGARGKPLVSHGSFAHWAKEPAVIIFPAACTSEKYPDPCARGAHTPVTDVTGGGGFSRGSLLPLEQRQLSFARHSVVIRLNRPRRSSSVMPRLHSRSASSSSAA